MKVYTTKTGQPYILLKSGKAKFIKKSRTKSKSIKTKTTRGGVKLAKKKTYRRKNTGIFGNLTKPMMGAGGVVLYESLISPMIPVQGVAKDMVELVGGLYLSKKKGMLGATGKALVTLNSYQLIRGMVGNSLSNLTGATAQQTDMYGGVY